MTKLFFRRSTITALAVFLSINGSSAQEGESQDADHSMKKRLGVKAGLNFLSLPRLKTADQTLNGNTGFFVGGYFSLPAKGIGYRSEIIFSRQGYDYKARTQTGNVKLDYIMLPQLMTVNITRFLQLQAGGQVAFLLNAAVDSSDNPSSTPDLIEPKNYYNKLLYGFSGGIEVKPFAGLLFGGRYNLFLNVVNEAQTYPPYVPAYSDIKNGLWQLYLGYQF